MPNVFDLSKISQLVDKERPARILVVDTNVLMNAPDPASWSVRVEGKSQFVISATVIHELEFISQKEGSKEKAESREKARTAIRNLASLFKLGSITDGIFTKAGWVIGVPTPRKDALAAELEQLEDIMRAFGREDTKMLLLTRECHQQFKSIPATLLTGEVNLFNDVQMQGVPCHLCTGFPIEGLKEAAATIKPVDWEKVLEEIDNETKQKAVKIEVTLERIKSDLPLLTPTRAFKPSSIIAEGRGVLRNRDKVRPFLWAIQFLPKSVLSKGNEIVDNDPLNSLPALWLDFFGEEDFGQDLFDAIGDRFVDFTHVSFEEGTPTLQSPQSVMEMLIYFEYIFRNGVSETAKETLR